MCNELLQPSIGKLEIHNILGENVFALVKGVVVEYEGKNYTFDVLIGKDLEFYPEFLDQDNPTDIDMRLLDQELWTQLKRIHLSASTDPESEKALNHLNDVEDLKLPKLLILAHGVTRSRLDEEAMKFVPELSIQPLIGQGVLLSELNSAIMAMDQEYRMLYYASCNPDSLELGVCQIDTIFQSATNNHDGDSKPYLVNAISS